MTTSPDLRKSNTDTEGGTRAHDKYVGRCGSENACTRARRIKKGQEQSPQKKQTQSRNGLKAPATRTTKQGIGQNKRGESKRCVSFGVHEGDQNKKRGGSSGGGPKKGVVNSSGADQPEREKNQPGKLAPAAKALSGEHELWRTMSEGMLFQRYA